MNGQFLADPVALDNNGTKLQTNAASFREDVQAIYNTVEDMIANDYISREAVEIGRKIESYQADLELMAKTIGNYGEFLKKAATAVRNAIVPVNMAVDACWAGQAADAFKAKFARDAETMCQTLESLEEEVRGQFAQIAQNVDNYDGSIAETINSME